MNNSFIDLSYCTILLLLLLLVSIVVVVVVIGQTLYDHLDPDKDTIRSQELSSKEVMDNEYSLMQNVGLLLEMANFTEIPRDVLLENLHDRNTSGIIVSVNSADYELLQVWTKGHEVIKRSMFSYLRDRLWALASPRHVERRSASVYTRVFLAVRSEGEERVHLKVFKQIHVNELEHLLPKGKIKMSNFDKRFLVASTCVGVAVPLVRALPVLADVQAMWLWGGAGLAAFIAGRTWVGYKNRRNQYLANLATTLYYKTVANNRGVLTLLCDRAQDEELKEAILAYVFLLHPPKAKDPGLHVYDTPETLKRRVEAWLVRHYKLENFQFDVDHALMKLDELGLVEYRHHGTLSVASLRDAVASLPVQGSQWVVRRDSESSDELVTSPRQEDKEAVDWR